MTKTGMGFSGLAAIALMSGAPALAVPQDPTAMLATGAMIEVAPLRDASTADLHLGDVFDVVVTQGVLKNGYVVIPRGTVGHARVSWMTGRGGFGKSGKMEFDLNDLEIDGQYIPVSGHYRIAGKGRTGEVIVAWVIGGVSLAAAVTGDDAVAKRGVRYEGATGLALKPQFAADPARGAAGLDPYQAGRYAAQAAMLSRNADLY
jgi:hypothetical protein